MTVSYKTLNWLDSLDQDPRLFYLNFNLNTTGSKTGTFEKRALGL